VLFDLVDLRFQDAELTVRVVTLVEGPPDGFLGTPMVVGERSEFFTVVFPEVAEFRSTAEPCFVARGERTDLAEFLFECTGTDYPDRACPLGIAPSATRKRHYCLATESIVLEVLSAVPPVVSRDREAGAPD